MPSRSRLLLTTCVLAALLAALPHAPTAWRRLRLRAALASLDSRDPEERWLTRATLLAPLSVDDEVLAPVVASTVLELVAYTPDAQVLIVADVRALGSVSMTHTVADSWQGRVVETVNGAPLEPGTSVNVVVSWSAFIRRPDERTLASLRRLTGRAGPHVVVARRSGAADRIDAQLIAPLDEEGQALEAIRSLGGR